MAPQDTLSPDEGIDKIALFQRRLSELLGVFAPEWERLVFASLVGLGFACPVFGYKVLSAWLVVARTPEDALTTIKRGSRDKKVSLFANLLANVSTLPRMQPIWRRLGH